MHSSISLVHFVAKLLPVTGHKPSTLNPQPYKTPLRDPNPKPLNPKRLPVTGPTTAATTKCGRYRHVATCPCANATVCVCARAPLNPPPPPPPHHQQKTQGRLGVCLEE